MAIEDGDELWMSDALGLAEASVGMASPNPCVGCVLVRGEVVVGKGAHHYDERDHAEVVALRQAGSSARGATAYVTLEPCSHTGRTPPCAEALIKAAVSRVVVATGDPNPLVNGRGIGLLREAGIEVEIGVLAERARRLNDGFSRSIRAQVPFVTLKAGVSLDGRIAPASQTAGAVDYLTGPASLETVHRLRHRSDAILTGIGTVLADDPLLTDRSGQPRRRPLLRVVLDSELRLPAKSRLVTSAAGDLLVCGADRPEDAGLRARRSALEAAGARVLALKAEADGGLDLRALLRGLCVEHGILNVLAEGGSRLNRTLLAGDKETRIADALSLFYAPLLLGDAGAPLLGGDLPVSLAVQSLSVSRFGADFCMQALLRDPWLACE